MEVQPFSSGWWLLIEDLPSSRNLTWVFLIPGWTLERLSDWCDWWVWDSGVGPPIPCAEHSLGSKKRRAAGTPVQTLVPFLLVVDPASERVGHGHPKCAGSPTLRPARDLAGGSVAKTHTPNAGGLGSISGQRGRSHVLQLRDGEVKVIQSYHTLCVHGSLQARILEWVAFFLLQGIFPIQRLNPGLPHCRQILCQLSHTPQLKIVYTATKIQDPKSCN